MGLIAFEYLSPTGVRLHEAYVSVHGSYTVIKEPKDQKSQQNTLEENVLKDADFAYTVQGLFSVHNIVKYSVKDGSQVHFLPIERHQFTLRFGLDEINLDNTTWIAAIYGKLTEKLKAQSIKPHRKPVSWVKPQVFAQVANSIARELDSRSVVIPAEEGDKDGDASISKTSDSSRGSEVKKE